MAPKITKIAATLLLALLTPGLASQANAAGTGAAGEACDLYADAGVAAGGDGSFEKPFSGLQRLADSLTAGQVGCLRQGTYEAEEFKITRPAITLTSYEGEVATIKGRLWIVRGADGVKLSSLALDGRNKRGLPSPVVNAADVVLTGLDITNYNTEICVKLGDAQYGRAIRTIIENSRIHNCGKLPAQNQDHGIYIGESDDVVIRNNHIYDNADRGIQVYPDAQGTRITGNIIDGNGQGIIVSGDGKTASSGTVISGNVISNSVGRWNIETNWPGGLIGSGNVAENNCVWASHRSSYYNLEGGILPQREGRSGLEVRDNIIANPRITRLADGRLQVAADSDCAAVLAGEEVAAEDLDASEKEDSSKETESRVTPVTVIVARKMDEAPAAVKVAVVGQVKLPESRDTGAKPHTVRSKRVKLYAWRNGKWRRVGVARTSRSGRFQIRRMVKVKRGAKRLRMRAKVSGAKTSRPVVLRVRKARR